MTVFLIVAVLLSAAALAFVLPPLLRNDARAVHAAPRDAVNLAVLRDQLRELDGDLAAGTIDAAGHASAMQELERRVAEEVQPEDVQPDDVQPQDMQTQERAAGVAGDGGPKIGDGSRRAWSAIVLGLGVPLLAAGLYLFLGTPAGLDRTKVAPQDEQAPQVTREQLTGMVEGLAQRMQTKPDDLEGWNMLARSYALLGRFDDAAKTYAHVIKLAPGNAELLADYADALAMSQNKSMQGMPEKLIAQALRIDPKNIKALALYGSAAYERHDYQEAATRWKKILSLVPPDSELGRATASNIDEAQSQAGGQRMSSANSSANPSSAAADGSSSAAKPAAAGAAIEISGTVELDPALRAKVGAGDTVFVFARAADGQGPRFPLAALRLQVKDLPAKFVLDDSMGVVDGVKMSAFPHVLLGARISKSGSATPAAGDLEGLSTAVAPGAHGVKIHIDTQRK